MKKIFTLIAAALMAASSYAQTSYGFYVAEWPWRYEASPKSAVLVSGEVSLSGTKQYAEYKLTSEPVDLTKYKGYKIEVADAVDGEFQLKIEYSAGGNNYRPISGTEAVGDFTVNEGTTSTFNLQVQKAITEADPAVTIKLKSVKLIANDGTEEECYYGGVSWGFNATGGTSTSLGVPTPLTVTYTGQYGGTYLLTPDGVAASRTVGSAVQTYTIKFDEPTPIGLTVELNNSGSGFQWFGIDAGVTEYNFTLNDEVASKDVEQIYIKTNQAADDTNSYPVKYASIVMNSNATAINAIQTKAQLANGRAYNLAGQPVSDSYKGIVIVNGKKIVK